MTELVHYEAAVPALRDTDDWVNVLPAVGDLAGKIASTEFVPKSLRGNAAGVAACVLTGRELGVGPMESLQKIHIIDGRPSLSAEIMRSLVLKAGHQIRYVELTPSKATVEGRRRSEENWTRVTWSVEDARRAGLEGKQNWKKHPRQMLAARATGELCRLVFPDSIGGLYTPEEIEDMEPETTVTVSREPAKRAARRRQPEPQATPEPPLEDTPETGDGAEAGDDSAPSPDGITSAQLKMLGALMREADITTRDAALAYVGDVIGRQVASRSELTKDEASRVIDALKSEADPQPVEDNFTDAEPSFED